jgi:hypothetical protein
MDMALWTSRHLSAELDARHAPPPHTPTNHTHLPRRVTQAVKFLQWKGAHGLPPFHSHSQRSKFAHTRGRGFDSTLLTRGSPSMGGWQCAVLTPSLAITLPLHLPFTVGTVTREDAKRNTLQHVTCHNPTQLSHNGRLGMSVKRGVAWVSHPGPREKSASSSPSTAAKLAMALQEALPPAQQAGLFSTRWQSPMVNGLLSHPAIK